MLPTCSAPDLLLALLLSFVLCSENYYGDDAEVKLLKKQQQKAKGKQSQKDDN